MPKAPSNSTDFRHCRAFHLLKGLATNPYDLTLPHHLSPERIARFSATAGEFNLLYATERVTEDVIEGLKELAQERQAVEKMEALQKSGPYYDIESALA